MFGPRNRGIWTLLFLTLETTAILTFVGTLQARPTGGQEPQQRRDSSQEKTKTQKSKKGTPTKGRSTVSKPEQKQASPVQSTPAELQRPAQTENSAERSGGFNLWWLPVVAIAVAAVIGTITNATAYHRDHRNRAHKARHEFEVRFNPIDSHQTIEDPAGLVAAFFTGTDLAANAADYVRLNLDATRTRLLNSAKQLLESERQTLFCLEVRGGRQQGKTLFLARLAHDLASDPKREVWSCKIRLSWLSVKWRTDVLR